MLEDCVWIVTADNGGPLDHSYNWPLRGGKHTLWEVSETDVVLD
jgi:hypothetical protein